MNNALRSLLFGQKIISVKCFGRKNRVLDVVFELKNGLSLLVLVDYMHFGHNVTQLLVRETGDFQSEYPFIEPKDALQKVIDSALLDVREFGPEPCDNRFAVLIFDNGTRLSFQASEDGEMKVENFPYMPHIS